MVSRNVVPIVADFSHEFYCLDGAVGYRDELCDFLFAGPTMRKCRLRIAFPRKWIVVINSDLFLGACVDLFVA